MPAAWMIQSKSGIGCGSGSIRSCAWTVRCGVPSSSVSHAGVPRMKLSHTVTRIGWPLAGGAVEVQRRLHQVVAEEAGAAGDQQCLPAMRPNSSRRLPHM